MSKEVLIIPISLSFDIEQACLENATAISEVTKKKIDEGIEGLQAIEHLKNKRKKEKESQENEVNTALDNIEAAILESGENGMPISNIMDRINTLIPTTTGFTQKMQRHLINKGGKHRLDKHRKYGTNYYRLVVASAQGLDQTPGAID